MLLPFERDRESRWKPGKPTVFAGDSFNQAEPVFSPDGRWLAYTSHETGRPEIVVRAFDNSGGIWQVSSAGGRDAAWSRKRSELLYLGIDERRMMVVPYTVAGASFRAEGARPWSVITVGLPARAGRAWRCTPTVSASWLSPLRRPDQST